MLLGLGWPEWLTIIGLLGALVATFWLMARASSAYERARAAREGRSAQETLESSDRSRKD